MAIRDAGTGFAAFTDSLTDAQAEALYVAQLGSNYEPYRTELPNNIIGAIWFADRVMYLTFEGVIPSYRLDFGSYDARFTYQVGSSFGDICYFITKVSAGEFLVGTNNDIYSFTGDFSLLDLGDIQTLDVHIRPLGVKKPPVNQTHFIENGSLYYLAEDGWRVLAGNSNRLISQNAVFSGAGVPYCVFLNALGYVLCIAADKKFMDGGILPAERSIFSPKNREDPCKNLPF